MNKDEVLQAVAVQLENNVRELSESLEGYRESSDLDEGDTKDMEDFSQQSEQKEMQYRMQIQLDQAEGALARLREFSGEAIDEAKTGALVETDQNWFFLGISFPGVQIDGNEVLGLSTESPAFMAMHGKAKGDTFTVGNNTHKIRSIS